MMTYPPDQSLSGYSFADTFEHLVQLRYSLMELIRKNGTAEPKSTLHSLFSSRKNFRSDELHVGLSSTLLPFGFSAN